MTTTTVSKYVPINIVPGVTPDTDMTGAQTPHFTAADKVRFVKGRPQKLGGWTEIIMNGAQVEGCARSIYSAQLEEKLQTIIGSSQGLYGLIGSDLNNVTPLQAATIAIPASLDTHYGLLANDPISTTTGTTDVVFADVDAAFYLPGDNYIIAGATDVGGIPAVEINKEHFIREVGADTVTVSVTSVATSTASGGGPAVNRSDGLIIATDDAHTMGDGKRVKITGATDTGGILAVEINAEFEIRNTTTNTFNVMTLGTSTSSVSGGGGGATVYQQQIPPGVCDETNGQGYGMDKYSFGLYGTALTSVNGRRFPRVWFSDTFGNKIVTTPGNGTGVYAWDGLLTVAPTLVPGAPTSVNYAFVSDNILVTFGAGGTRNRIFASDQGDFTNWVSSSTNQVYDDDIEGASLLRSHVSLNGTNLIFTNNQCYTFRYIGLPFVWEVKFKDSIGIISPMARVVVKGVAYWMGPNNFYMWRGGNIEVIPSNTSGESTMLNYVFKNLNRSQLSKCFAWYNDRYDEIWFHYPSEGSNEIDRLARYHVTDKHWTPDTFNRTAAEYRNISQSFPRLISNNILYRHETGNDDGMVALPWTLTTNLRDFGTDNVLEPSIVPDSVQSGDITLTVEGYSFPQSSSPKNTQTNTIAADTEFVPLNVDGRFMQYIFSGEELGQQWIMGRWMESIQVSSGSQ